MIVLHDVSFSYRPGVPVLRDASCTIGAGLTLLVGPNGCGKSTLVKLAAGVERPDSGAVTIHGHDLWRAEVEARRSLAYVPEQPDLTPYATVLEVLALVCRLRGEPPGRADSALAAVGLAGLGGLGVRELSMGQRRRAVLAAAWIGEPAVVLLDEPLETLDRAMRATLLTWVEGLCARGACVVVVAHEIEPFAALATRTATVRNGGIEAVDPLPVEAETRLVLLDRLARGEGAPGALQWR